MKCKCGEDLAGDTCPKCGVVKAQVAVDPMVKAYDDALTALTSFSKAVPPEKKDEEPPKKKDEAPPEKKKDEDGDEGEGLFEEEEGAEKSFRSGLIPESQDAINAVPILENFKDALVKALVPHQTVKRLLAVQNRAEQFNALLAQAVVAQGEVIKSLTATLGTIKESLEKFGTQPAGRKGAINVFEKALDPGIVSAPAVDGGALIQKAIAASARGFIGPGEVGEINTYCNRGMADKIPAHLMAALNKVV